MVPSGDSRASPDRDGCHRSTRRRPTTPHPCSRSARSYAAYPSDAPALSGAATTEWSTFSRSSREYPDRSPVAAADTEFGQQLTESGPPEPPSHSLALPCSTRAAPYQWRREPEATKHRPIDRRSTAKKMTGVSLRAGVPTIRFDATLYTIDSWTIVRLPQKASGKLPSRGQVAVQGTINGHAFQTVLEPDGNAGHWMRIDGKLQQAASVGAGDTAKLEIESIKDWPEPDVPRDLATALGAAPQKSKTYGETSRRWRAGSGFAGSMQPKTLIRANDGSK